VKDPEEFNTPPKFRPFRKKTLPGFVLAVLVVIPKGDQLLSLSLPLLFSCHPSPKAEDLPVRCSVPAFS
jgi:hypothetical protein